jgi:hypothetical protein
VSADVRHAQWHPRSLVSTIPCTVQWPRLCYRPTLAIQKGVCLVALVLNGITNHFDFLL